MIAPISTSARAPVRLKAYQNCLRDYQIQYNSELIFQGIPTLLGGYEATTDVLKKKPTGIFCVTDALAVGLIKGIHESGLKVPDDISIVGYGDSEYAMLSDPSITTVRAPRNELGRVAAKILISKIQKEVKGVQNIIQKTELIIRRSSGPTP